MSKMKLFLYKILTFNKVIMEYRAVHTNVYYISSYVFFTDDEWWIVYVIIVCAIFFVVLFLICMFCVLEINRNQER